MSKVCSDAKGLFVFTGAKARPGGVRGYSNAYRMDDAGLTVGDKVKVRAVPQTPLVRLTLPDGTILHWHKDYS